MFTNLVFHLKSKKSNKKKKKKQTPNNWFETLTIPQIKELCKACKLKPLTGTKMELCQRLLDNSSTKSYGYNYNTITNLKRTCKEKNLIQSGNKYDLVLRLIQNDHGTGQSKRTTTTTTTTTGEEQQDEVVITTKKRKINPPKPETMYKRMEKKMKSVSQKKYQGPYTCKQHCPDVFDLLSKLTEEYCMENGILETNPMLAFQIVKAGWSAIYDFWQVMERPGYGEWEARKAFEMLEKVLLQCMNVNVLSSNDIEAMVVVLENVNACLKGYGLNEAYHMCVSTFGFPTYDTDKPRYNIVHAIIRKIMPDYDPLTRETKPKSKLLECDIRGLCAMNGIPYPGDQKEGEE